MAPGTNEGNPTPAENQTPPGIDENPIIFHLAADKPGISTQNRYAPLDPENELLSTLQPGPNGDKDTMTMWSYLDSGAARSVCPKTLWTQVK